MRVSGQDALQKRLGQVFTGPRLALLLASLAEAAKAGSIVDPMAGSGDMLAACWQVGSSGLAAAIDIDPRVAHLCNARAIEAGRPLSAVTGTAFASETWESLPASWDLVITNPPYVRYQTGGSDTSIDGMVIPGADRVRNGLVAAIGASDLEPGDRSVFERCALGYSGLADLAVPSWLLCASRVKVGGRLALVAPATWLSRDYAAPVLYILRRYFDIEFVVEDADRAWFPSALVRTTLVVARRVSDKGTAYAPGRHLRIAVTRAMADETSLVGSVFHSANGPEWAFAEWARNRLISESTPRLEPITAEMSDEGDLIRALRRAAARAPWVPKEDPIPDPANIVPELLRARLPQGISSLTTLDGLGWRVGQGLRTGANDFFYLTGTGGESVVRSQLLPGVDLRLPADVLQPAVRAQFDLPPTTRVVARTSSFVLILDRWALSEDIERASGPRPWRAMAGDLERLVRAGAVAAVMRKGQATTIPELSAVVTNVRASSQESEREARFWYQLPRLAARHVAPILVARINSRHPLPYLVGTGLVVDANFSTLWPALPDSVSAKAMLALLSSSWVQAFLESTATVMGGGALKVEATHLRQLLLPTIGAGEESALEGLAEELLTSAHTHAAIDAINDLVFGLVHREAEGGQVEDLATRMMAARSRTHQRA
jgi:N-6 DNA Methylase